jgi:hypothetical protein
MESNPAEPYHFAPTAEQLKKLRSWAERANALGRKAEFLAALKIIYQKLTTEPLTWGDPLHRLNQLGLQVYHRVCSPFHVAYAVDEERRIVYIKKFTLLSGSGLQEDE